VTPYFLNFGRSIAILANSKLLRQESLSTFY